MIECGAQATGGNYAFFAEVPGLEHPGFPIAEVAADGSSVITKHEGTGGLVSVGTVTAQLLYEIAGPAYANPDVTARFDTLALSEEGPDRVRIAGARGEAPPDRLKVALNDLGGFRNQMTLVLTGLDIEAKAALAERTLWAHVDRSAFETVDVQLVRHDREDPRSTADAQAHLRITVTAKDPKKAGRAFSNALIEMGLASYPGYFPTAMPGEATPYGVYWPTTVPAALIEQVVTVDGAEVARVPGGSPLAQPWAPEEPAMPPPPAAPRRVHRRPGARPAGPGLRRPLGRQGRQRQRRRVGPQRRGVRLAGRAPRRRPLRRARARGGRLPGRPLLPAEPARGELRRARPARPRGRGQRAARPAGQGPRRAAAGAPRRPAGGAAARAAVPGRAQPPTEPAP